jgi:hypothetical protein
MRIDEIASAEDQIALFKLITDKVWQSLAELERADAEAKAQQPLKTKLTAKSNTRKPIAKQTAPAKPKQPQPQKTLPIKHQQPPQSQNPKQQVQPVKTTKQSSVTNPSNGSISQVVDDENDLKKLTY